MMEQLLAFEDRPLSENFLGREFRCSCCGRVVVSLSLVKALQELRSSFRRPVRILSGYRCPVQNLIVSGAARSWHTLGLAADITADEFSAEEVSRRAFGLLGEGRLGYVKLYADDRYVHVDTRAI